MDAFMFTSAVVVIFATALAVTLTAQAVVAMIPTKYGHVPLK